MLFVTEACSGLRSLTVQDERAWAEVELDGASPDDVQRLLLHPGLMDAALQATAPLQAESRLQLPVEVELVVGSGAGLRRARVRALAWA